MQFTSYSHLLQCHGDTCGPATDGVRPVYNRTLPHFSNTKSTYNAVLVLINDIYKKTVLLTGLSLIHATRGPVPTAAAKPVPISWNQWQVWIFWYSPMVIRLGKTEKSFNFKWDSCQKRRSKWLADFLKIYSNIHLFSLFSETLNSIGNVYRTHQISRSSFRGKTAMAPSPQIHMYVFVHLQSCWVKFQHRHS